MFTAHNQSITLCNTETILQKDACRELTRTSQCDYMHLCPMQARKWRLAAEHHEQQALAAEKAALDSQRANQSLTQQVARLQYCLHESERQREEAAAQLLQAQEAAARREGELGRRVEEIEEEQKVMDKELQVCRGCTTAAVCNLWGS